jgi:hypothetical protein
VLPVDAVVAAESWAATRTGCRAEPEAGQCQLQQLQVQLPQSDLSPSLPERRKPQIHRRPKLKVCQQNYRLGKAGVQTQQTGFRQQADSSSRARESF